MNMKVNLETHDLQRFTLSVGCKTYVEKSLAGFVYQQTVLFKCWQNSLKTQNATLKIDRQPMPEKTFLPCGGSYLKTHKLGVPVISEVQKGASCQIRQKW